jgi:hypothetical protein
MTNYQILKVPSNATPTEITAAYVRMLKAPHSATSRKELETAYEVLSDFAKRNQYDRINGISPTYVGSAEIKSPTAALRAKSRKNSLMVLIAVLVVIAVLAGIVIYSLIPKTKTPDNNGVIFTVPVIERT